MKNGSNLIHSFAGNGFEEGFRNGLTKLEHFTGLAM